jgi:energy-coupling factor transport system permease protein
MDTRGYGRSGGATRGQRWLTGGLLMGALMGTCVGTYAWLDPTAPRVLALPMLVAGVVVAALGLLSAGRRVQRTRYRPDPWRWPETVVAATGVAVAALAWHLARTQVAVAFPGVDAVPYLTPLALAVGLLGLLPLAVTQAPAGEPPAHEADLAEERPGREAVAA